MTSSSSQATAGPSMERCPYCLYSHWLREPYYVYFSTDKRESPDSDTYASSPQHIGLDRSPYLRLHQQNRREGFHTGSKPTNLHGEHWQIEFLIGPFYEGGSAFKELWRTSARGLASRYEHAAKLVAEWKDGLGKDFNNTALIPGRDFKEAIEYFEKLRSLAKTQEEKDLVEYAMKEIKADNHGIRIIPRDTAFARCVFSGGDESKSDYQFRVLNNEGDSTQ